jgi:hypothetical protein
MVVSSVSGLTNPTAIKTSAALNEITNDASIKQRILKKKRGRPKGLTIPNKVTSKQSKQKALKFSAAEVATINESPVQVPKGTYEKFMFETEAKHGLKDWYTYGTSCT